jgi:hypothetical protein
MNYGVLGNLGGPPKESSNQITINAPNPCPGVFFFGAGASVPAGVPATIEFVAQFRRHLQPRKRKCLDWVISILKNSRKMQNIPNAEVIDVELLLETLVRIENLNEDPFLASSMILKYYGNTKLSSDLKCFIKEKGKVDSQNTKYLEPLSNLITIFGSIQVISTNYDIVVEQFCRSRNIVYDDGFGEMFEPERLKNQNAGLKLYKIHGSILWYKGNSGAFYKVPIISNSNISTVFNEDLQPLIIYPMRKWEYLEPTFRLTVEAELIMRSPEIKFIFVFGYSFRDEHIRNIFFDLFRERQDIICVLVDPNAYNIYKTQLKYYDKVNNIASSMAGRVICHSNNIQTELGNFYIAQFETLEKAIALLGEYVRETAKGNYIDDGRLLYELAKCNYIDALKSVIPANFSYTGNIEFWKKIEIALIIIINAILSSNIKLLALGLGLFTQSLLTILSDGCKVEILNDKAHIRFGLRGETNQFLWELTSWGPQGTSDGFGPILYRLIDKYNIFELDSKVNPWRYRLLLLFFGLDGNIYNILKEIRQLHTESELLKIINKQLKDYKSENITIDLLTEGNKDTKIEYELKYKIPALISRLFYRFQIDTRKLLINNGIITNENELYYYEERD